MIALSKAGKNHKLPSSYRPISLLSLSYRFLERLVLDKIMPSMENVLSVDQAGFRPGRSCFYQVLALSTYIENGFQSNLKTGVVFLDLTAAYDTVWHKSLLVKLSRQQPRWVGDAVETLLRSKSFRVHMSGQVRSWRQQSSGFPQISVLALLFFSTFTQMIYRQRNLANSFMLMTQASSFTELEATLTCDILAMEQYRKNWRLIPSATKTVSSVFHLQNAS